jgi:hypothetical protein
MSDGAIKTDGQEVEALHPSARARTEVRSRGRPKGTNYRRVDRPLHELMRQILVEGIVATRTAAARFVVEESGCRVYGGGTDESKIDRLVRTFPF